MSAKAMGVQTLKCGINKIIHFVYCAKKNAERSKFEPHL